MKAVEAERAYEILFAEIFGREEGPYGEPQIAQMFADGRIDRNTPCKPADP
jgi:hypothetical protein